MKNAFRLYLPQVLLIVFSVVLGLVLNDAIKKRQDRKMAIKIVNTLKGEIVECRESMLFWQPYHKGCKLKLDSLRKDKNFVSKFIESPTALSTIVPKGIYNGNISMTAWETAKISPVISQIDYKQLRELADVYNQIDVTFSTIGDLSDIVFSSNFNGKDHAESNLQRLSLLLRELIGKEHRLIQNCNKVLGDTMQHPSIVIDSLILDIKKRSKKEG